jgi:hypothetical protein
MEWNKKSSGIVPYLTNRNVNKNRILKKKFFVSPLKKYENLFPDGISVP